jgi:hypothetical protein
MTTATLKEVQPGTRPFTTKHGDFAAFGVVFEDGRIGEVVAKANNVEKRQAEFSALVGKPSEFVIEDGGLWPNGEKRPLKVKLPAPAQGFGGGGGGGQAAFRNTREGQAYDQERTDRRTALMQAVAMSPGGAPLDITQRATFFYDWLRETSGEAGSGARAPVSPGSTSGEGGSIDTARPISPDQSRSPEPVDGEATGKGERGETSGGGPVSDPTSEASSTHIHGDWKDAPKEGWVLCGRLNPKGVVCGYAERAKKVEAKA